MKRVTLINMIMSLLLQLVTIISGFIIPKIILTFFGSSTNGLISSLNQFLSYITLIEGGITGVITASLYKPIVNDDEETISSILKTSRHFFRKIGIIYIVYSIFVAIIYPILFDVDFSFYYVFTLTIILSMNLFVQYMFSLSYKVLLTADKKIYIVSAVQIFILILNTIFTILFSYLFKNIHIVKLVGGLLYFVQPIIFVCYINKHYKIEKKAPVNDELIKERWNGFAINLAAFIHFSTDITILTIFTNLKVVSIYSIYSLVTSGLRQLIHSISSAINPTVGNALAKGNEKELNLKMDLYEFIIFMLVFFTAGVGGMLITPFVQLYTNNITDTNYYQPVFGVLLIISEALYLLKYPHLNLAYSANEFKRITKPAYIEAVLNIIFSIILVNFIGISGVVVGTIIGMIYRMIFHVWFTKKIIFDRKQRIFYKKFAVFCLSTIVSIVISLTLVKLAPNTILNWIIAGFAYSIIFGTMYLITSLIFFKKEFEYMKKYIIKK